MIDISDGLSSEALHLCKASKVGCSIYEEKVPLDSQTKAFAEELSINPLVAALNGGEDYELLFTVPLASFDVLKKEFDITIIGHITPESEGANLITTGGSVIPLQAQGWNPLMNKAKA
jgi:thiamine-monophosphate kinase